MKLKLQPMSERDCQDWLAILIPEYAQEKVASGAWKAADALRRAEESTQKLLPEGVATPGQWLFSLRLTRSDERVGYLWLGESEGAAYVYDLYVYPEHRRQGYGSAAMQLVNGAARERGFDSVGLHVFGENHRARDLYLKQGYRITDLTMAKSLLPPPEGREG